MNAPSFEQECDAPLTLRTASQLLITLGRLASKSSGAEEVSPDFVCRVVLRELQRNRQSERATPITDGAAIAQAPAPSIPEAIDLAIAAEAALATFRGHRTAIIGSPDWSERDRASFAVLERALRSFWSREKAQL